MMLVNVNILFIVMLNWNVFNRVKKIDGVFLGFFCFKLF